MADIIKLARNLPIKGTAGTTYYQLITDSIDVSPYDSIDWQMTASTDFANGVTIDIITSMQNTVDDISMGASNPSWYTIGSATLAGVAGVPYNRALSVPVSSTGSPMLRWIRYQIKLNAGVSNALFTIEGLARRGLRVG